MHNYKDWENFCNYLISENRYILNDKYKKLTEEIVKLAKDRELFFEQDSIFWRARTSKGLRVADDGEIVSDRYTEEEISAPPNENAKDGRANPAKISYLYLAENLETAIAEVKPDIGDLITIASFSLKRKIRVVDITQGAPSLPEAVHSKNKESFSHLWFGIKMYFQVPIKPQAPTKYIPTQYIAELFKNNGYDGVKFDSVQKNGKFNLVLFEPSDAQLKHIQEKTIAEIEYVDLIEYYKRILYKNS